MKETYVPIRPGILEHLLRGDISACEFGVYAIIHLQADYKTGFWRGSAARLTNTAPRGADLRRTQRALEHLTDLGLLKPFHTQGARGNYPVAINKYTVRSGALKGQRLNAEKTMDWRTPVYEFCAEDDAVAAAESDAVGAPIQEVRSKREERRKTNIAPSPPSAISAPTPASLERGTQEVGFEVFWDKWPRKQQKAAAWKAWQKIPFTEYPVVTAGLEKWLTSDQWARGVIPHPATWLNGKRWQDEDIPQSSGERNARPESFADRNIRRAQEELGEVSRRAQQVLQEMGGDLPESPDWGAGGRALPGTTKRSDSRPN